MTFTKTVHKAKSAGLIGTIVSRQVTRPNGEKIKPTNHVTVRIVAVEKA